jgi:nucleoside-diphosphate-sugar epimerase
LHFDSASGFIGLPAAQACVRAGHQVYGLTRSQEKAKQLIAEESGSSTSQQLIHLIMSSNYMTNLVIPVIGEVDKPAGWIHIVKDLDAMIDCVGGTADIKKLSEEILQAVSNAARELRPQGSPKLTYIYTSGTWVHGDNRSETVTDTTPIRSPPALVAWRPGREQQVITDKNINGIVIRPALLYGRSGSLFAPFFQSACEGNVWYPGHREAGLRSSTRMISLICI